MSLLILFGGGGVPPELQFVDVDVLSRRLILLKLQDEVVVNADYFDINNYTISVVEGTGPVEIVRILPFKDGSRVTRDIIIETQPMTYGVTYSISINAVYNRTGVALIANDIKIDSRFTKVDSILRSIPKHYDKRPTSNLAGVMLAIGRQDDLIGGSRDDDYTF